MRRIVAMLLAVLVAAVISVGILAIGDDELAEATHGDSRKCVTPREAKAIELSMTRKQVKRIFDSKGWLVDKETVDGMRFQEREYRACWSKRKDVHVYYVNGRAYAFSVDWGWWE